jgi:hypothetical protein
MALNLSSLNQRFNYLLNLVNSIITGLTPVPTSSNLSDVLTNGNSAGTNDINMNSQDISNVKQITLDVGGSVNNIITDSTLTITDTSGEQLNLTLQGLVYNNSTATTTISNDNGQDIGINAGGNINLVSGSNIELDCPMGVIDAKSGNFNLVNNAGGGSIILLDDAADNIQMTIEASAGNTGLFTNDGLLLQCENMDTVVRQGLSVINSDTNRMEMTLGENVDGSALAFIVEDPSAIIESNNDLSLRCENMDTLVRQGSAFITSDTNLLEIILGENGNGSNLYLAIEDPSITIESSNNLSLRCENMDTVVRQGSAFITSDTNSMYMALGENVDGSALQFVAEDPSAIIESNNELSVISDGDLTLRSRNGNVTIDVTNNAGEFVLNGTDLISNTSGGNSGAYLVIRINGTQYKINLEDP